LFFFFVLYSRSYSPSLALAILTNNNIKLSGENLGKNILDMYFTSYDVGRLEKYSNNMSDYHLIMDLVPPLARLYFFNLMGNMNFSPVQSAILLSLGLQYKNVDQIVEELNKSSTNDANILLSSQVLGLFNRIISRSTKYLNDIIKADVGNSLKEIQDISENMEVSLENRTNLHKELEDADKELKKKQQKEFVKLKQSSLQQYAIKGTEADWSNALKSNKNSKNLLSVKSVEKQVVPKETNFTYQEKASVHNKKRKKTKT
jgi:N-acetyltransferase 10